MVMNNNFSHYIKKSAPFTAALIGMLLLMTNSRAYKLGLLILCSLAGLYVYTRLKRLLPATRWTQRIFSLVFLLLFLAYPLIEWLSHSDQAGSLKYVLLFGYYSLPFLLYIFLLAVLGDLLLALNRRLKIVPPDLIRNRKLAAGALTILLAGSLAIIIAGRIHYENIKVNEYAVAIPGGSARIDQLKIAMAADFHIGDVTEPRRIETIIRKINSTHADIILLPGDLLEGDRKGFAGSRYAAMFKQLRAKYGVFASMGNHEYHHGIDCRSFFELAGIELLEDRFVIIDQSFCLAGRSDSPDDSHQPLEKVLRGAPPDLPLILMDHNPSHFAETLRQPVDIQLSAHSHHGQLFPLHFISQLKYDLSWGSKHIGRSHFFVTSGAQTWGFPVRTVGDSEIMLIRVSFTHSQKTHPLRPMP
jgi:predicted MPP superfamily phosphohydrolase